MNAVSEGNRIQKIFLGDFSLKFTIDHLNAVDVVQWMGKNYTLLELNLHGPEELIDFLNRMACMNEIGRGYMEVENTKEKAVEFLGKFQEEFNWDDLTNHSCIFYHLRENAGTFFGTADGT
ncbi:MAG: hypothetical protein SGARI_006406 [Bacillariaceae sp.]